MTFWNIFTTSNIDQPLVHIPNEDIEVDGRDLKALCLSVQDNISGKVRLLEVLDQPPAYDLKQYVAPPVNKVLVSTRVYCSDEERGKKISVNPKIEDMKLTVEIKDSHHRLWGVVPYVEVTIFIPTSVQRMEQFEISVEHMSIEAASLQSLYIQKVKLTSNTGSISVQLLRAGKFNIFTEKGSIKGNFTSGGEGLKVQTEKGAIDVNLSSDSIYGVPTKASLHTEHGSIHGSVIVREDIKAKTEHGLINLKATSIAGSINLKTEHGPIQGTYTLEKEDNFSAKSEHGTIQVDVLGSAKNVTVKTDTGSIQGNYQAGGKFEASTEHGSVQVNVTAAATGHLPKVKVSTETGAIQGTYHCAESFSAKTEHGAVIVSVAAEPRSEIQACTQTGVVEMNLLNYFEGTFTLKTQMGSATIAPKSLPNLKLDVDKPNEKRGYCGAKSGKIQPSDVSLSSHYGAVKLNLSN